MKDRSADRNRLLWLINGYGVTQAISCAVGLRLPELVAEGPRTIQELASATSACAFQLEKLIRALATIGVFTEHEGQVRRTSMSDLLRREDDESVAAVADFHGREMYAVFSGLLENVRSGAAAWPAVMGTSVWEYFSRLPDRGAVFDRAMQAHHAPDLEEIIAGCEIGSAKVIVDVGGGDGTMLRAALARYSGARGVLLDVAGVIERSRRHPEWAAVSPRCELLEGDMFEEVPRGGDLYLLRHVLHDWDDASCLKILRRCRAAMKMEAKLLVIEQITPVQTSVAVAWQDLGIMAFGGTERSASDYQSLFSAAGLSLTGSRSLTRSHVLEARVTEVPN